MPMPVFIQRSELQAYANSLPIEFLDMQDHHKFLFGGDRLERLVMDRRHLRAQCAQELSVKQLKLRQAIVSVRRQERSVCANPDAFSSEHPDALPRRAAVGDGSSQRR